MEQNLCTLLVFALTALICVGAWHIGLARTLRLAKQRALRLQSTEIENSKDYFSLQVLECRGGLHARLQVEVLGKLPHRASLAWLRHGESTKAVLLSAVKAGKQEKTKETTTASVTLFGIRPREVAVGDSLLSSTGGNAQENEKEPEYPIYAHRRAGEAGGLLFAALGLGLLCALCAYEVFTAKEHLLGAGIGLVCSGLLGLLCLRLGLESAVFHLKLENTGMITVRSLKGRAEYRVAELNYQLVTPAQTGKKQLRLLTETGLTAAVVTEDDNGYVPLYLALRYIKKRQREEKLWGPLLAQDYYIPVSMLRTREDALLKPVLLTSPEGKRAVPAADDPERLAKQAGLPLALTVRTNLPELVAAIGNFSTADAVLVLTEQPGLPHMLELNRERWEHVQEFLPKQGDENGTDH